MIYETKNLTLEQVDQLYEEVTDARKSQYWEPSSTFRERQSVAGQGGLHFEKSAAAHNKEVSQSEHAE